MSCGPATNARPVEFWCRKVPGCQRCTLAATSEPHWKNWGLTGPLVPLSVAAPPTALAPLPARRVRCVHLGAKVDPGCACQERHCLKGHGVVRLLGECQACPEYTPATPGAA